MTRPEIDIRPYQGQKSEEIVVGDLYRSGRINSVEPELWIVGNDHLSYGVDVEFTQKVAGMMAEKLKVFNPECIFTAASKPIPMAYEMAKMLGHKYVAVARKNISPIPPVVMEKPIRSITSGRPGSLMIDGETAEILRGKRVALFDDVISLGDTMKGLRDLTLEAGGEVAVISTVWLEGAAPYKVFEKEFRDGKLVSLATFPFFAMGQVYLDLLAEKKEVEEMFKD